MIVNRFFMLQSSDLFLNLSLLKDFICAKKGCYVMRDFEQYCGSL